MEDGSVNDKKQYAQVITHRLKMKNTGRAAQRLRKRHKPKK